MPAWGRPATGVGSYPWGRGARVRHPVWRACREVAVSRRPCGLPYSAWAFIITFVPVLGGLAYLSVGRHGPARLRTLPRTAAQALRPQG
jgi:Phospholipase_D-nuclease N-terminal